MITDRGLEHRVCFDSVRIPLTNVQRLEAATSIGYLHSTRSKLCQPTGTYNINPLYWVSKCELCNAINHPLTMTSQNVKM